VTSEHPIERVIAILMGEGFRPIDRTLTVASVPFPFAAVLLATGKAPDLVVVVDTVEDNELRIRQKLEGLGRALDVAGSRRPVTAILVGPKPSELTINAVSRVCRVLPVGTPVGPDANRQLRDWLAVLLPLRLADPNAAIADPIGELAAELPDSLDLNLRTALLNAAAQGTVHVRRVLAAALAVPLEDVVHVTEDPA
jgi:hypothetical protein